MSPTPTPKSIQKLLSNAISHEELNNLPLAYTSYLHASHDISLLLMHSSSSAHDIHLEMMRNCVDRMMHLRRKMGGMHAGESAMHSERHAPVRPNEQLHASDYSSPRNRYIIHSDDGANAPRFPPQPPRRNQSLPQFTQLSQSAIFPSSSTADLYPSSSPQHTNVQYPPSASPSYKPPQPTAHPHKRRSVNYLTRQREPPKKLVSQWSRQYDRLKQDHMVLTLDNFVRHTPYLGLNTFGAALFHALNRGFEDQMEELQFKESLRVLTHGDFDSQWQMGFSLLDEKGKGYIYYDTFRASMLQCFDIIEYLVQGGVFGSTDPHISPDAMKEHIITNLFRRISNNTNSITREFYQQFVNLHPQILHALGLIDTSRLPAQGRKISTKLGFPVSFGHTSWKRVLAMMAGIERCIIFTMYAPPIDRKLLGTQSSIAFRDRYEYTLPAPDRLNSTDADASSPVRFTALAPIIFKELRSMFGISEEEYRMAFGLEQVFGHLFCGQLSTLSENVTEGKSGSFFYSTSDGMFMAKTISISEYDAFKSMLPQYYTYMRDNPNTLITRMYGLYKLEDTPFIVMENVFKTRNSIDICFDLKGSTHGRKSSPDASLQKDLNWMEQGRRLEFGSMMGEPFLAQLKKDVEFLRSLDIIDYSLIVGISEKTPQHYSTGHERSIFQRHAGGVLSHDHSRVYYVGIIDCLITYNLKKKAEKFVKALYTGDEDSISVTTPQHYASRFGIFMQDQLA